MRDPETVATSAESDTVVSTSSAYIVAATGDGEHIEQWIATGTAATALMKVRQNLPPGWLVSLTGASLTLEQAAALGFDRTVKLSDKPPARRQ
jgi:hypothetical protein